MHPVERILSLFSPDICLNCGAEGSVLCLGCQEQLDELPSVCYSCGRASRNNATCQDCGGKWKPRQAWIYSEYKGLAKELVHAYKFDGRRSAAAILASLIESQLHFFTESPLVTFVPTSPSRVRERGFDHAALLAKCIARQRSWPYAPLLVRKRQTRQLGADRQTRKNQLKSTIRPINGHLVTGRHIILVDDVTTTGATLEVCSRELIKAGASQVDAAVFARTPNR